MRLQCDRSLITLQLHCFCNVNTLLLHPQSTHITPKKCVFTTQKAAKTHSFINVICLTPLWNAFSCSTFQKSKVSRKRTKNEQNDYELTIAKASLYVLAQVAGIEEEFLKVQVADREHTVEGGKVVATDGEVVDNEDLLTLVHAHRHGLG